MLAGSSSKANGLDHSRSRSNFQSETWATPQQSKIKRSHVVGDLSHEPHIQIGRKNADRLFSKSPRARGRKECDSRLLYQLNNNFYLIHNFSSISPWGNNEFLMKDIPPLIIVSKTNLTVENTRITEQYRVI